MLLRFKKTNFEMVSDRGLKTLEINSFVTNDLIMFMALSIKDWTDELLKMEVWNSQMWFDLFWPSIFAALCKYFAMVKAFRNLFVA